VKVVGGGLQIGMAWGELGGGGPRGREEEDWVEGGFQREPSVRGVGGVQQWRRWLVDQLAVWPCQVWRELFWCTLRGVGGGWGAGWGEDVKG